MQLMYINAWEPAVYMSCMSQNFRLFHVSNLSVRNFRIVLLMYTGSLYCLPAVVQKRPPLCYLSSRPPGTLMHTEWRWPATMGPRGTDTELSRPALSEPGYMSRKIGKFRTDKCDT